jgi:hypothetical protein
MDMSAPVPPLLVAEGDDLTFFRSQRALGSYIEPWFVDVEHQAWDGLGRRLNLVVVEPRPGAGLLKRAHPYVEAGFARKDAAPDGGCAMFLREWLPRVGGPDMPPSASLSELLVQALLHGDIH